MRLSLLWAWLCVSGANVLAELIHGDIRWAVNTWITSTATIGCVGLFDWFDRFLKSKIEKRVR